MSTGSGRHRGEEGRCLLQDSRVNKIPVLRKTTSRTCRLREWYAKMQTPRPRQSCPRKFSVLVRPHFRMEAASYGLLQRHSSLFYTYSQVPGAPSHTHAPVNRFLTHRPSSSKYCSQPRVDTFVCQKHFFTAAYRLHVSRLRRWRAGSHPRILLSMSRLSVRHPLVCMLSISSS